MSGTVVNCETINNNNIDIQNCKAIWTKLHPCDLDSLNNNVRHTIDDDEFFARLEQGLVSRKGPFFINTINEDVAGTSFEIVSPIGGQPNIPLLAAPIQINSTSNNDIAGGVGAQVIIVTGLDDTFTSIIEFVPMNGLASVFTAQNFFRISASFVFSAGSSKTNLGNINLFIGGLPILRMLPNTSGVDNPQITLASNRNLSIRALTLNTVKGGNVQLYFGFQTSFDGVTTVRGRRGPLLDSFQSSVPTPDAFSIFQPGGADSFLEVFNLENNPVSVSVTLYGVLYLVG